VKIYSLLALVLILSACSIVPPVAPEPKAPLADGNHLDAGIYFNATDGHLHARQFYVDRWNFLVAHYGLKVTPPVLDAAHGLTLLPSGEYLVTVQVTEEFERLDRRSRIAP
jgi:hypothetical protein